MTTKPSADLQWATDDVTTGVSGNPNKLEPFDFKSEGQQEDQPVPRQYLNFQFNAIREWKDYLEGITDSLLASSGAALQRSLNLSDLTDIATARNNLGLSNVATLALASLIQAQSGTSSTVLMTPERTTDHFNSRTTAFTRTILSRSMASEIRSDLALGTAATSNTGDFASSALVITAGNGLSGGGNLTTSRTITLGTPSTITAATTNSVSSESHSHAITLSAADVGAVPVTRSITAGNGLTGGGLLNTNMTLNVGAGDGISVATDTVAVDSTVIRTSGSQSKSGTMTFTSTVFAPFFRTSSDPQLKDNMQDHEAVSDVDLIKLKSWTWKHLDVVPEQLRGKADSGVDASVVAKVFPSCVEKDANGFLTVDYGKLAVHLILSKGV
jgi:hypothetical protein